MSVPDHDIETDEPEVVSREPIPRPRFDSPQLQWGSLTLASRYFLAPLAGYTNLGYRTAVRELGGLGLATSDLVNARALLNQSRKTMDLIQTDGDDRPVAIQIYGADANELKDAAQWLEGYGISAVDINMGCPVHKVVRGGGGSAMMCNPTATIELVRTVVESVKLPVSVKMRLGWDDTSWSAPYFAREFEQAGVAGITIHGRTREQGFKGRVNLDGIRAVVEAVERIPIIGNGDVRSIADAAHMFQTTGCAGIAIGRGALLNPWFFAQLETWEATGDPGPSATYGQRLDFMHRHFHLQVKNRGEHFGCLTFRKAARWYCKVLRPGKEIHHGLMMVESPAEFDGLVNRLRERPEARNGEPWLGGSFSIPVPAGPNERW